MMTAATIASTGLQQLSPLGSDGESVNIVIETPRGCRNKYAYDPDLGLFVLKTLMPAGSVFPFDFGFLPGTLAADGDPLDVLVLMEEAAFVGCLVPARLIGVIEAEQTEREGEAMRNDRLVAVAAVSRLYAAVRCFDELDESLVAEVEQFFISYNALRGKQFKPLGRFGPERARQCLDGARASGKSAGRSKRSAGRTRKTG